MRIHYWRCAFPAPFYSLPNSGLGVDIDWETEFHTTFAFQNRVWERGKTALKREPLDRQTSGALFFRLSESPALAGDEFRKNSGASRRRSRRTFIGLSFLLLRFFWTNKENEDLIKKSP